MRKILSAIIVLSFFLGLWVCSCQVDTKKDGLKGTITISGAWALYPMAVKWAEEFQKIHKNVKIDVSAGGAGKGMADCLAKIADIGMVSREIYPEEVKKGAWHVAVTKDAVVPTVHEANPLVKELLAKGIAREGFIGIWITENIKNWGELIGGKAEYPIHVYTRSDSCGAAETWAAYLGKKQEDLTGVGVYGDPGLAEAVRNDNLGIGFNNINYAYDGKTKKVVNGLKILPLDINGNGKIDSDEDFYGDRGTMANAIASGKYPSPPARNLHFVCGGEPQKKEVREFIKWVLTEGQKYVPETGYINLTEEKLKEEVKKLGNE